MTKIKIVIMFYFITSFSLVSYASEWDLSGFTPSERAQKNQLSLREKNDLLKKLPVVSGIPHREQFLSINSSGIHLQNRSKTRTNQMKHKLERQYTDKSHGRISVLSFESVCVTKNEEREESSREKIREVQRELVSSKNSSVLSLDKKTLNKKPDLAIKDVRSSNIVQRKKKGQEIHTLENKEKKPSFILGSKVHPSAPIYYKFRFDKAVNARRADIVIGYITSQKASHKALIKNYYPAMLLHAIYTGSITHGIYVEPRHIEPMIQMEAFEDIILYMAAKQHNIGLISAFKNHERLKEKVAHIAV